MKYFHKSVLLKETIKLLQVKKGKKYVDATLGGGGHTEEILKRGGIVLGIDIDQEAIDYARDKFKSHPFGKLRTKVKIVRGNFRDIDKIARSQGFEKVAGIIFDLGVSSYQLEEARRGFSFLREGPLDMRMDPSAGSGQALKASDLVNLKSKNELYEIFSKLGEEPNSRAISTALVRARRVKAILTTEDLASVVEGSFGFKRRAPDFIRAKILNRVFQALRIAVNSELESLEAGLKDGLSILESEGRLLVISFHSLEDRIVKRSFLDFERAGLGKIITKKPIAPSYAEVAQNRRAKSAKLRVFQKT